MITQVETKTLREALHNVCMTHSRYDLPMMSYIKMMIGNNNLHLATTDMERAIEVDIACPTNESKTVFLPRKSVNTFIAKGNGKTDIAYTKDSFIMTRENLGSLKIRPHIVKDDEYPLPPPRSPKFSVLDAKWFCQMIGIVMTACAKHESRPVLSGACFKDGVMASADGFRLVVFEDDKLQFGLAENFAIVPLKTLALVKRLFEKNDEIEIGFSLPDFVYFKTSKVLLTSTLIKGNFPNWKLLIPTTQNCKVTFSVPLMLERLQTIDPRFLYANLTRFQFHNNNTAECIISGGFEDPEDGDEYYNLTVPVKLETKVENPKIAINYKYICEALNPFSVCDMELSGTSQPVKITGDIKGLTVVVMPMYVQR